MEDNGAGREYRTVQAASPPNGNNEREGHQKTEDGRINPWRAAMSKCSVCATKFTLFNHSHICGWCKRPACDKCSRDRKVLRAYHRPSRVCDYCIERFWASKEQQTPGDAPTPAPLERDDDDDAARPTVPALLNLEDSNCSSVAAPSTADLSPLTTSSGGTFFPESDAGTHPTMQQPAVSTSATRENAGEGGARVRFEDDARVDVEGEATVGVEGEATAGVEDEATAGVEDEATAAIEGETTAGVEGEATAAFEGEATVGVEGEATAGVEGEGGERGERGRVDLEGEEGLAAEGDAGVSTVVSAGFEAGVEREGGAGVDLGREEGFHLEGGEGVVVKSETEADVKDEARPLVPGEGEAEVNNIMFIIRILRLWENRFDLRGYSHLYVGLSVGVIATGAGYCLGYLVHRRL